VVAFTLALFSQLVQQVIDHIQDSVFNISFQPFASPTTIASSSVELDLTALSARDSNIKMPHDGINMCQQPSDQSCTDKTVVTLVNGCADEKDNEETKALKKKRSKRLQRLKKRRRRRRRRLNSSEDSDLSDGNFRFVFLKHTIREFEVLTAVVIRGSILRDITPCSPLKVELTDVMFLPSWGSKNKQSRKKKQCEADSRQSSCLALLL
jgi:hypothetical protein